MTLLLLVVVGLACAVSTRRWLPARSQISTASTTIACITCAVAVGLTVDAVVGGTVGDLLALVLGAGAALGLTHLGAQAVAAGRRRRAERTPRQHRPVIDRLEDAAQAHPITVFGLNLYLLVLRCARRIIEVRVTGLAAEMTYYALISIVPLITAFGAALGSLERFLGAERVDQLEATVVEQVVRVFDAQVAAETLTPLVEGLLGQERAGVAIGGLLVTLWLASRMFRAAIRALDDAYGVPDRRNLLQQSALGLALALGAVLTLVVLLSMVVVGPLLGGGREIADLLGLGDVFAATWSLLRWLAVAVVAGGFLVLLYRFGPNVDHRWWNCLPGAVAGLAALVAVAAGFQVYLGVVGSTVPGADAAGQSVAVAAQMLGAVLAGVLWLWGSSIVILAGGVLNAEVKRMRREAEEACDEGGDPAGSVPRERSPSAV